jgi:hypothetical protein
MVERDAVHGRGRGRCMSKAGVTGLIFQVGRKVMIRWHGIFERRRAHIIVVVVVQVPATVEVRRSFMFMSPSILSKVSLTGQMRVGGELTY